MVLKTYADWEDAVRAARVVYDHSRAKMVTRTKAVRKSRKTAFLSVLAANRQLVSKCCSVASESDATLTGSTTPSSVQKSQTRQRKYSGSNQAGKTGKIQIFISTPLTSTVCLQLHQSTSISDLKRLLQDKLGIESEKQHLFTRQGLELCDVLSIADHGIEHDATIELRLVSGLLGGRKKNNKSGRPQKPKQNQSSEQQVAPASDETPVLPPPPTQVAASAASNAPMQTSTQQNIGVVNIQNVTNSPIVFGNVLSSSFNYPQMQATVDVMCKKKTHEGMNGQLFEMLKRAIHQSGKTYALQLLFQAFTECDTELQEAAMGSVKFTLRVKTQEGLDRLWGMYTTGELGRRLTEILITNELTTEDKTDLAIRVTMLEPDHRDACRFFDQVQQDTYQLQDLPVHMSDWTKEHVKCWLLSIGVADSVANEFYDEDVNGKVLEIYRKEDLIEDFNVTKGNMRLVLHHRDQWLESEKQLLTPPSSGKPMLMAPSAVSQDHSETILPPDAVEESVQPRSEETPQPAVRPKIPMPHSNVKRSTMKKKPAKTDKEQRARHVEKCQSEDKSSQTKLSRKTNKIQTKSSPAPSATRKSERDSDQFAVDGETTLSHEAAPFQISQGTPQHGVPESKSSVDLSQSPHPPKPQPTLQSSNGKRQQAGSSMPAECKTEQVTHLKPPTCVDKTVQDTQTNEARLRTLLTGDDRGDIDQLSYPLLVANKTPTLSSEDSRFDYIRERFGFIKTIKWTTALDFDSNSLSDGLCKLYHDDRKVTLQQPDLFKDIESEEELRNKMGFPEKTLWLFSNGREDNPSIQTPHMDLQEWNKERSRDVEASISFFAQPSVIPKGRAAIVFLLMSDDDLGIICDIFRKMSSSFKGLENITCIAEDENVYLQFVKGVEKWFTKSELDERSFVGLEWQETNRIIMRMSGVNQINANQLPTSTNFAGKCFVSEKQRDEWDDIAVVCKNECENTDMDESSQGYQKFAEKKELNFYRGGQVDWWNFAIGEKERQIHKSCGHVLKRNGFGEVLKNVSKPLGSSKVEDSLITTVTLLHQPGAGGSTMARHVLWQLHKDFRCIVVNRITSNTVNQIMEVRKHGYKKEKTGQIPPVCVLIDNFDDLEVLDLIGDLEEASRGIHLDGGAVCVLLNCKRNMDPLQMIREQSRSQDLFIPLTHKLSKMEKEWFQEKYRELERKENEFNTGDYNPDNLLAFMVMKEEFDKGYIKRVVSQILNHDDIKSNEISLIKYCAFLNSYMHEAEIPISCCDLLMETKLKSTKTTYLTRKHTQNWEKQASASFKIIVVMTENRTLKIFHKFIAEEALRQTLEMSGDQSVTDVALEFLESELLRSPSHSKKELDKTVHNLLIRRIRLRSGDNTKTNFSGLIEDVCKQKSQGPKQATKILETGLIRLNDAFVAQHLARLYLKEGDFQMAHVSIDKALEINPKKPYFWDTKGRIFQKQLKTLSAPCLGNQQVLDKNVSKEIIQLSFSAIDAFRKSFDFSKETMQMEFSALYAVVSVAFELLDVISLCVEPFRSSGKENVFRVYLLNLNKSTDEYPKWDQECNSQIRELKDRIDSALDIMDNTLTYYKDGSSANIVGEKLDKMREELKKYSNMQEKYYGEPFDTTKYNDPKSLAEHRRRSVIELHCSRFGDIFNLAEENKENLEISRQLLLQNLGDYNLFDLKVLVFIHLALSSSGEEKMPADEVYAKLVRPLNDGDHEKTNNSTAPFLMMMFLWPIQDAESERRDRKNIVHYIEELRIRADGGHSVSRQQMSRQEKSIGHTRFNMKPRTHFFLGRGQGLKVFVHINEILATQNKLERREFWQSSPVKDRLVRLEGILLNNTSLVYRYKKDKKITIKLAVPSLKHTQSQESVTFYLGFSWSGPVAYSVTPKGKESCDDNVPRHFNKAYPKYILPARKSKASSSDDTSQINHLQKEYQELDKELQELQGSLLDRKLKYSEKQDITRRIAVKQRELDKKAKEVMHAWQKDTYDDG